MSCLKLIIGNLDKAISIAKGLSIENKCNFVIVMINKSIMYDKESCWIRDGRIGKLIKTIVYEDNM